MKKWILLATVIISAPCLVANNPCGSAYQDASYAIEHSEKAMQSNNIEHLKQYAQRALEAIDKVYDQTEKCGCLEASNSGYDAKQALNKALEKEKFEVARFYVKNALSNTRSALVSLDLCNEPDPSYDLVVDENNLLGQEEELLQQQQELLKKQKALEAQLKAQRELQNKLKVEKAKKMEAQLAYKNKAEAHLLDLETAINRFIRMTNCSEAEPLNQDSYSRSLDQLEQESLNATKVFYTQKAREMADQLIMVLASCN